MKTKLAAVLAALSVALPRSDAGATDPARYELRVSVTWSAATHPFEFPVDAHFSGLFGVTHDPRYTLFRDGHTASSGLELIAENGRPGVLEGELREARRRERVGAPFVAPELKSVPGEMAASFEVGAEHPLVSFVTMIAPSPDWITGVTGLSLMHDGQWLDRIEITLWAWDAGTDGGTTFHAEDDDTQPRESVRLLATPHFLDDAGLRPIGKATFVRKD